MERRTLNLIIGGVGLLLVGIILIFLIFGNRAPSIITIHFDVKGGVELDPIDLTKGTSTLLPTPYKEGYVFKGWYVDGKQVNDLTRFTEDQILEAKWVAEEDLPVQISMVKKQSLVIQAKKAINTATQRIRTAELNGTESKECYTFEELGIISNGIEGRVTVQDKTIFKVSAWQDVFGVDTKLMDELDTDDTSFTVKKPIVTCE